MKKVLLSQEIHQTGLDLLKDRFEVLTAPDCSQETMLKMIKDVDAIVLRTTSKVNREIIENADSLKIISRTGMGVDNVDIDAASERNILVCNLPMVNNLSVCEHAISMMLTCAKQIPYMQDSVRQGNWKARNANTPVEVEGKTLGIVGLGNIGSLVAKKCHDGLGMKILAYDPYVKNKFSDFDYTFCDNISDLFKESDFVTLHCPNINETKGMVTRELLFSMKKSAYLINTARGGVVDEAALIELLSNNLIAGAGLDVFETEPPAADNPLLHMGNVVVSPHSAAMTKEATIRMSFEAAQAVVDYFDGRLPRHIYNKKQIRI